MKSSILLVVTIGFLCGAGCQQQRQVPENARQHAPTGPVVHIPGEILKDGGPVPEFFAAVEEGDEGRAVACLGQGVDIRAIRDCDRNTALHTAAHNGHPHMIRMLCDGGANIDARNLAGMTPLMAAAAGGHRACVETLLQAGADQIARNEDGLTALDLARQNGHTEVVRLLEEYH